MFFHTKHLAHHAKPERPDPIFAKQLQEPSEDLQEHPHL